MKSVGFIQAQIGDTETIYPKINIKKETQYISIGNLFMVNDKIYTLTCNHCIKNTVNHEFIFNNKIFSCTLKIFSEELELALLEIHGLKISTDLLNINDLDLKIQTSDTKMILYTLNIDDYIEHQQCNPMAIECFNYRMVYKKMESLNIPELPSILMQASIITEMDMHGMSGSLIFANGKILGMLSNIKNSDMYVIPSRTIYRFLMEFIKTNNFVGLCTIVGDTQIIEFETDEGKQLKGIHILNTLNIDYNNYPYTQNRSKCSNFKLDDIIINIDNKEIVEDGKVYDDFLQTYINYQSYISLNYICGDEIKFNIMRCVNIKLSDYKEQKLLIRARPLNSIKYIPLMSTNNIFTYNGLVFGIINENIIKEYNNVGINIGYSLREYYINNPYRNEQLDVIVLLDINKNGLDKKIIEKIDSIGLPVHHISEKEYAIPVIKKINKHKITSLEKLKEILVLQLKNTIYITMNNINIKIQMNNKQIIDIQ